MKFVLTILIAWYGNIVLIRQFLISFSVQLDSIQPKVFLQFLAIMEHSTSWMHQMFCLSYIGNGVTILLKHQVSSLFLPVYIFQNLLKFLWYSFLLSLLRISKHCSPVSKERKTSGRNLLVLWSCTQLWCTF